MSSDTPPKERPALRVVDPLNPPANEPLTNHPLAWWLSCKLRTTLSEPPVHEITLPNDGKSKGKKVVLTIEQMLSPHKMRIAFYDRVGFAPPLEPDKNKVGQFLRDVVEFLFENRIEVPVVREASDRGTLETDIENTLRTKMVIAEDLKEVESGARLATEGGWIFSARVLLDRIKRSCPVKFTVTDYYAALKTIGCSHPDSLRVGRNVRAWLAPASLFADAAKGQPEASTGIHEVAPQPPAASEPQVSGTYATVPPADDVDPDPELAFPFVDADEHDAFEPPPEDDLDQR